MLYSNKINKNQRVPINLGNDGHADEFRKQKQKRKTLKFRNKTRAGELQCSCIKAIFQHYRLRYDLYVSCFKTILYSEKIRLS